MSAGPGYIQWAVTKGGQQWPVFLAQQSGLEFPMDGLIQHKEQGAPLDSIKSIKRAKKFRGKQGDFSPSLSRRTRVQFLSRIQTKERLLPV
jgi:hypothetical protein